MLPSVSSISIETPSSMALPFAALVQDVTCPICLEFLKDPVNVDCGHSFCQQCITAHCDLRDKQGPLTCPSCTANIQKETFRPSWQLANLAESIKLLPREEALCRRHKEKLNLFCQEDEELLCVFCEHSAQHQSHTVLLLEKAAQDYKERVDCHLKILQKEKEKIVTHKEDIEKETQYLLRQIRIQSISMMAEISQLYRFMKAQKKHYLAQVEEIEKDIKRKREEHLGRLSSKISTFESLITEMEEKEEQPACELLQDIRSVLQRWEKKDTWIEPVVLTPEMKWKIWHFWDRNSYLICVIKKFKEAITFSPLLQTANISLDPDTAHPNLLLSEDGKNLRVSNQDQVLPNDPKRFTMHASVLGTEGFQGGRHSWEVTVGGEGDWAVGVAKESVKRKECVEFIPKDGIWAIEKREKKYRAADDLCFFHLLSREPQKIQVILNHDGGHVAFFDADTADLLLAFSEASFCGETLLPFFYASGNAHLRLSP